MQILQGEKGLKERAARSAGLPLFFIYVVAVLLKERENGT